ncbi:MAG: RHS repeat-associated core domain-containing protein [Bacteroidota bacterium]
MFQRTRFVYIYISNEDDRNITAYFDDFEVQHTYGSIAVAKDQYPFGLALEGRKLERKYWRYGYQGEYAEKDEETQWNAFQLRQFDPVIGRWTTTDPYGQYPSPYLGMGNNPMMRLDPDGGFDWYRNKEIKNLMWREGSAEIEGYENLGATFSGFSASGTFFQGFEDGSYVEILNTIEVVGTKNPVTEKIYNGQRKFLSGSFQLGMDLAANGATYTGYGLAFIPGAQPAAAAFIAAGNTISTINSGITAAKYYKNGEWGKGTASLVTMGGSMLLGGTIKTSKNIATEQGKNILEGGVYIKENFVHMVIEDYH